MTTQNVRKRQAPTPTQTASPLKRVESSFALGQDYVNSPTKPFAPRKLASQVDPVPNLVSEHVPPPAAPSTSLLTPLQWFNNSCWLDVGVEALHTLQFYGAVFPDITTITRPSAKLALQCLAFRSDPNGADVARRKNDLWQAAFDEERQLNTLNEVVRPGELGEDNFVAGEFFDSDPNFWKAIYDRRCTQCGASDTKSSAEILDSLSDKYPNAWRNSFGCGNCKANNLGKPGEHKYAMEIVNVTHAPTAVPVSGLVARESGLPRTVDLFGGHKYTLVFVPVNPPGHFIGHVRFGNTWYTFDPGRNRRHLQPRDFAAPQLPPSTAVGISFYVRSDAFESASQKLPASLRPPATLALTSKAGNDFVSRALILLVERYHPYG